MYISSSMVDKDVCATEIVETLDNAGIKLQLVRRLL